jgi:hypothetical protein
MLVLLRTEPDDKVPRAPTLPQYHADGSAGGGVGRQGPGRRQGPSSQPQVGEEAAAVLGAVGVRMEWMKKPVLRVWTGGSFGRRRKGGPDG